MYVGGLSGFFDSSFGGFDPSLDSTLNFEASAVSSIISISIKISKEQGRIISCQSESTYSSEEKEKM